MPLRQISFTVVVAILSGYSYFLVAQQPVTQYFKGYPDRSDTLDVLPGFIKPPRGYGNVPFYWWNGDSLTRERMTAQLEILSGAAIDGFAVSYIHSYPAIDTAENKHGYGAFGKPYHTAPEVFSKEWWDVWSWFTGKCAEKGIGLGLDDYVLGNPGNGFYPDELSAMPKFADYQGELVFGENGITTKKGYLLHPDHGKELVRVYFDRFEKHAGSAAAGGMNYFFQDELLYPLKIGSWSDDFEQEFQKRKGYEIKPYLRALNENIGAITPKIRLDYCEVLTDLSEERYFRPIYEWHAKRGLIYGCDNNGRGLNPLEYVDYFRATSWFTAPGNDAPARGSSFLQTKVSSSIAHLYDRPRTWLEAFHSMGWGSSGAWLTHQLDHHYIAGGNLLCLHGLYYSTHGGWWEWAPPDFHFRMPYWEHTKKWLEYTERMSYLMSQGRHVCDIALMYPTEPMQAYPESNTKRTFELAMMLSNSGLDYDFMDFRSLRNSVVGDKSLTVAGEKYRVLILSDMKAMHHSTLLKALEHFRGGGIVLCTGEYPQATTLSGEGEKAVDEALKEMFGLTASEVQNGKTPVKQTNTAGGVGIYLSADEIPEMIYSLITPDFRPAGGVGKVLHRRVGKRDVYMVMDVPKGQECFFRAKGKAELWNVFDGTREAYPVVRQTDEGTFLKIQCDAENSSFIVFSAGEPVFEDVNAVVASHSETVALDGEWETELLPTLDNRWGDYRLPPTEGLISAEGRTFRHCPAALSAAGWFKPAFDDSDWTESVYGFGFQFRSDAPVEFSWQYGVYDQPGSQGYHGLKGKVNDGFLILDRGGKQVFTTFVYASVKGDYRIETVQTKPDMVKIDGKVADSEVVTLDKGWHPLEITFNNTEKGEYEPNYASMDTRARSAVVLLPVAAPAPVHPSVYDNILAMSWFNSPHLVYDPYGGKNAVWNYRFRAVPGLKAMDFAVAGRDLKIWIDGTAVPAKNIVETGVAQGGVRRYRVTLDAVAERPPVVAFSIEREKGFQGAAAVCEPVKLLTDRGLLAAGNWSESGALKYYSGGMYYRKSFTAPADARKVILNLGEVIASCEVRVNGQNAGILISPPYEADITRLLKSGRNELEILVYSTLSNHYQTIPSFYKGDGRAGLIGPVNVSITK